MTALRPLPLLLTIAVAMVMMAAKPARADLKLCNKTGSTVGVAVGYKRAKNGTWISEGWWNIPPRACKTLIEGTLIARYYYIYAVDYDKGGSWPQQGKPGNPTLCTRDKIFTINGRENCEARGYRTTSFYEVDTGEEYDWTISLTDPGKSQPKTDKPGTAN